VHIEASGQQTIIVAGNVVQVQYTPDAATYPYPAESVDSASHIRVNAVLLAAAMVRAIEASSKAALHRHMLECVGLHFGDGSLSVVGTDSKILSLVQLPAEGATHHKDVLLLPNKSAKQILRMLKTAKNQATLIITPELLRVCVPDGLMMTTHSWAFGKYPNYQELLNKIDASKKRKSFRCLAETWNHMLDVLATSDQEAVVTMSAKNGKLNAELRAHQNDTTQVSVAVEDLSGAFSLKFNSQILSRTKHVEGMVEVEHCDNAMPLRIKYSMANNAPACMLIMPLS